MRTTSSANSTSRGHPRLVGSTMPGTAGYGTTVGSGTGVAVGSGVAVGTGVDVGCTVGSESALHATSAVLTMTAIRIVIAPIFNVDFNS